MALPTVTASSVAHSSGSQSSLTLSHTSDTNPLYVHVQYFTALRRSKPEVTYGGTALTLMSRNSGGDWTNEWWVRDAPSAGAANIVATPDANAFISIIALNINNGVVPTIALPSFAFASGTGTAPTVNVTSRTGDLVFGICISDGLNQVFTNGAGQTTVLTDTANTSNNHVRVTTEAGAASVTTSYTLSVSDNWAVFTFSVGDAATATIARLSQETAEAVTMPTPTVKMSQITADATTMPTPAVRLSQITAEVVTVHKFPPISIFRR